MEIGWCGVNAGNILYFLNLIVSFSFRNNQIAPCFAAYFAIVNTFLGIFDRGINGSVLHIHFSADQITLKTAVAEPSQKPIWNATLLFSGVDGESLMKRAIEVTLWDFCPDGDNVFLGECSVDLQRALENDRAVW